MNTASRLLAALSDTTRAKVFAWVLLQRDDDCSIPQCARELGYDLQTTAKAASRLIDLGLIVRQTDQMTVHLAVFADAVKELDQANPMVARLASYPSLAPFFDHGTLREFPVNPATERDLAHFLVSLFSPDNTYSEKEFNDILTTVHRDYATLRRRLVDLKLVTRTPFGDYRVVT